MRNYTLVTVSNAAYGAVDAATVTVTEWCVSYMLSEGVWTLQVFQVEGGVTYHPLHGTTGSRDGLRRIAYEAGLLAYMVYN